MLLMQTKEMALIISKRYKLPITMAMSMAKDLREEKMCGFMIGFDLRTETDINFYYDEMERIGEENENKKTSM